MDSTEDKVKKIVMDHLGIEESKISLDSKFIDDLGADSLDTVELVMAFEEQFDIELPDEAAETILTVQNAVDFIDKKKVKVTPDGYFVFGLGRDRKNDVVITINKKKIVKKVYKRKYNIQRIDGLEEKKVTPPEEVYERIKRENQWIGEARAVNSDLAFFKNKLLIIFLLNLFPNFFGFFFIFFIFFLIWDKTMRLDNISS